MTPTKAYLQVVEGKEFRDKPGKENRVEAQFNPQSLQVTYRAIGPDGNKVREKQTTKVATTDQQTGSISEVSMELLFDTSDDEKETDVRNITVKIAAMIRPDIKTQSKITAAQVPNVRFGWGTFVFVGKILSMSETIDFFSQRGIPLRSTVKLSMSEVQRERGNPGEMAGFGASAGVGFAASTSSAAGASAGFSAGAGLSAGINVGSASLTLAQAGDTLQGLAARAGANVSWKAIAAANNIDNPRMIPAGTPLNLNVSASGGFSS